MVLIEKKMAGGRVATCNDQERGSFSWRWRVATALVDKRRNSILFRGDPLDM